MFGKYYRNETFTYWFFSFMPLVILAETVVYMWAVGTKAEDGEFVIYFLAPILGMTSAVLILIQVMSQIIFVLRLLKLNSEQKANVRKEAESGLKRGRLLKTDDVLIYYGMFSKKVLLMSDILDWYPNAGTSSFYAPRAGTITMNWDCINVKMRNGRTKELNCSMACFGGAPGELPVNSLIAVILLGLAFFIMWVYPKIMGWFAGTDPIERMLYYAGYDAFFWLLAVLLIAVIGVTSYYLRYRFLDSSYDMTLARKILGAFALFVLLFLWLIFQMKYDEADLAREDLKAYKAGALAVMEQESYGIRENTNDGNGWGLYGHMARLGIKSNVLEFWSGSVLLIDGTVEKMPESGKIYRVYYLENTKILVDFEEVE